MHLHRAYRVLIILGFISYSIYWFLPYSYGRLDSDTASLLSYAGYGAVFSGSVVLDYVIYAVWFACSVGMYFYYKMARDLFLGLVVITTAMVPFYGVSLETASGAMLLDLFHLTYGAVLAMAYFSSIRERLV